MGNRSCGREQVAAAAPSGAKLLKSMIEQLSMEPAFIERVTATASFPGAPPGQLQIEFEPLPMARQPAKPPFATIIGAVHMLIDRAALHTAPQRILRHGTEVMQERTASRAELETGFAGALKKIGVLELADAEIFIEQPDGFKHPP